MSPDISRPPGRSFSFRSPVAIVISGYGFFEARQIRTERIEIRSAKLPKTLEKLRIVQISDVHIGVLVRGARLAEILRRVREESPDLVVATGDLVDGQLDSMDEAAAQLREISPRYGKFAVTGNHEFYAGLDDAINFIKAVGIYPPAGRGHDRGRRDRPRGGRRPDDPPPRPAGTAVG